MFIFKSVITLNPLCACETIARDVERVSRRSNDFFTIYYDVNKLFRLIYKNLGNALSAILPVSGSSA